MSFSTADTNTVVFGLIGAGGFAREVMPIAREYLSLIYQNNPDISLKRYFVETNPTKNYVNDVEVISEADFLAINCKDKFFNIAIADSQVRQTIAERLIRSGMQPLTIQSVNAITYDKNKLGEGAIICANSMITSNARIGKFFHSNIYSYVAHDCIIGDYVTFAPRVCCNGNVHIHDHAYIGTGAVIKQGSSSEPLIIGEGAIVGMGAVVTKDVPPYSTVIGNPARPREKN
jgi:sugar O-acyltransferase (sialic acid O-acetyltransferase NeuD family)